MKLIDFKPGPELRCNLDYFLFWQLGVLLLTVILVVIFLLLPDILRM